jgi:hypothetical protein
MVSQYASWLEKYYTYDVAAAYKFSIPSDKCYKIKKCFLIEKNRVDEFLEKINRKYKSYSFRFITGTNLSVYYDYEISWWKQPKFGYKKDWLPNDIEEKHINITLRNRDKIINLLPEIRKEPLKTNINY